MELSCGAAPSQGNANSIEQLCVAKWFCEVANNPGVKGARTIVIGWEGSYENRRNCISEC
jgi:hypothetical protein